jgi:hypothetical protein
VCIFFIFWSSKICINLTGIVSTLFPPRCCLSSGRHCHAVVPCHACFPFSQDELIASASSSSNTLSGRIPSRATPPPQATLPRPLTPTLQCYKKIISNLTTLHTTQLHLHFASSLPRAPRHRSSTSRSCSLSPPPHTYYPSAQRHLRL